jgi:hypothetical protein
MKITLGFSVSLFLAGAFGITITPALFRSYPQIPLDYVPVWLLYNLAVVMVGLLFAVKSERIEEKTRR